MFFFLSFFLSICLVSYLISICTLCFKTNHLGREKKIPNEWKWKTGTWDYSTIIHLKYQTDIPSVMNHDTTAAAAAQQHYSIVWALKSSNSWHNNVLYARDISRAVSSLMLLLFLWICTSTMGQKRSLGGFQQAIKVVFFYFNFTYTLG